MKRKFILVLLFLAVIFCAICLVACNGDVVIEGKDGKNGIGIKSSVIDGNGHLIITYTNDTWVDAGLVKDKGLTVKQIYNYYESGYLTHERAIDGKGKPSSSTTDSISKMFDIKFVANELYMFIANGTPITYDNGLVLVTYNENKELISKRVIRDAMPTFKMTEEESNKCFYYRVWFLGKDIGTFNDIENLSNSLMLIKLSDYKHYNNFISYGEKDIINNNYLSNGQIEKQYVESLRSRFDSTMMKIAYCANSFGGFWGNTVGSYTFACLNGADAIKGDVRITSDGVLVMCHDAGFTFDKNGKITTYDKNNNTLIRNMTYEQISGLDYVNGDKVATLEEMIKVCKKYGVTLYINLRDQYIKEEVAPKTVELLKKYGVIGSTIIGSLTMSTLFYVRSLDRNIMLSYVDTFSTKESEYYLSIDTCDYLGNCIYFMYDCNGRGTTSEDLISKINEKQKYIDYAKNKDLRIGEAILGTKAHLELMIEYGFSFAHTSILEYEK